MLASTIALSLIALPHTAVAGEEAGKRSSMSEKGKGRRKVVDQPEEKRVWDQTRLKVQVPLALLQSREAIKANGSRSSRFLHL